MSEGTEGDAWAPSLSLSEDGAATFEVVEGDSRNMSVTDLAAVINKGLGYDESTQKAAAKTTELQGKFDELTKEHGGWTTTFQRFVDKLKGLPEGADLDTLLDQAFAALDTKPASKPTGDTGDDWFNKDDDDGAKPGLTQEQMTEYVNKELQKRDSAAKSAAEAQKEFSESFEKLRIPKDLQEGLIDLALKGAVARGTGITEAVEHEWKAQRGGHKAYDESETALAEAEKHAAGGNISKAGQRATSGDDPRAKAPLGSPEHTAYLGERLRAKAEARQGL